MAIVPMRLLLDHAAENGYGIAAYNVNNMEQIQAIMQAAHETDSPVILQASRGARKYAGENFLRHLILAAVETYPHIPIAMHQDHGNSPSTCYSAVRHGFTSVMMDGSLEADAKTPASYEYNVAVTSEVVKVAHAVGVSVEGELGCLGSLETGMGDKEDGHGAEGVLTHDQLLTDPDQAVDFVEQTQVDALAVAIGTSHGAYKFTRKPTGEILAISRIEEIHNRLPNTHLVMHGSSSVPEDLIAIINKNGGQIPETYGVPVEEIQKGIKSGVRKVNIDTDNRLAITAAVREALIQDPKEFDPRHFLKPSIKYMQKVCADRYQAFGSAGYGSKIKQINLDEFAAKYAKGELNAVTKKAAVTV
jgi:fructose-bisphosphate aldolase class II